MLCRWLIPSSGCSSGKRQSACRPVECDSPGLVHEGDASQDGINGLFRSGNIGRLPSVRHSERRVYSTLNRSPVFRGGALVDEVLTTRSADDPVVNIVLQVSNHLLLSPTLP